MQREREYYRLIDLYPILSVSREGHSMLEIKSLINYGPIAIIGQGGDRTQVVDEGKNTELDFTGSFGDAHVKIVVQGHNKGTEPHVEIYYRNSVTNRSGFYFGRLEKPYTNEIFPGYSIVHEQ